MLQIVSEAISERKHPVLDFSVYEWKCPVCNRTAMRTVENNTIHSIMHDPLCPRCFSESEINNKKFSEIVKKLIDDGYKGQPAKGTVCNVCRIIGALR